MCISKRIKWIKKKSHREKKNFCIFFQSPHQVDMKNVVECPREFIAHFNALETTCVLRFVQVFFFEKDVSCIIKFIYVQLQKHYVSIAYTQQLSASSILTTALCTSLIIIYYSSFSVRGRPF